MFSNFIDIYIDIIENIESFKVKDSLFFTTSRRWHWKSEHADTIVSGGIEAQAFLRDCFRWTTFQWGLAQALLSKMDHME